MLGESEETYSRILRSRSKARPCNGVTTVSSSRTPESFRTRKVNQLWLPLLPPQSRDRSSDGMWREGPTTCGGKYLTLMQRLEMRNSNQGVNSATAAN